MLSIKVEPLARDIELLIAQDLSPEAQSATLAAFARQTLTEVDSANAAALGHTAPHDTFVDGREGASEDTVRPAGRIVYEFQLVEETLAWIGEQLVLHSPRRSGRYAASHILLADGVEIDPAAGIPMASEYVFSSLVPYARKIEGDDNRAPESEQAPDGVYEVVAALANRQFGNVARIRFSWRPLQNAGALTEWANSASARLLAGLRRGSAAARHDWLTRQPAIIVTVR